MRPGVLGRDLQAYAAAGIRSDHEAYTAEEGRERLRAGMWLLIREASAARNLRALAPLVGEFGPSRMAFCTDDREPEHIAEDGHINAIVRDAVSYGIAPEDALVMASHHPALWHGLDSLGAIAPGYQADLLLLPDLERFIPEIVLKRGRAVDEIVATPVPEWVTQSVRVRPVTADDFAVEWEGGPARVIGLVPGQIVTESLVEELSDGRGRPGARPGEDRRDRAASRHRPDRARLRARLRPHPRRLRLDVLPRRPQRRRRRHERRRDGARGRAPGRARGRPRGRRRRHRHGGAAAAGRGPALGPRRWRM